MNGFLVIVGFAAIGGILAGYLTARLGRGWMVLALWMACAVAIMGYAMFLDSGTGNGAMQSPLVLYGVLIPFSLCVALASLIGAAARTIMTRKDGG